MSPENAKYYWCCFSHHVFSRGERENSYDPKTTRYFSFVDFANYFCERENFCVSFSLIFILNAFGQSKIIYVFNTPFQINQSINNKAQGGLACSVHNAMRLQHVRTPWVCAPTARLVDYVCLREGVLWKNPRGSCRLGYRPCEIVLAERDLVTSEIAYRCSWISFVWEYH